MLHKATKQSCDNMTYSRRQSQGCTFYKHFGKQYSKALHRTGIMVLSSTFEPRYNVHLCLSSGSPYSTFLIGIHLANLKDGEGKRSRIREKQESEWQSVSVGDSAAHSYSRPFYYYILEKSRSQMLCFFRKEMRVPVL